MHLFKHFFTITKHRFLVRKYCFKCGLFWRGLVHDLSKYSLSEFIPSAKYYQGNCSPTIKERKEKGYSSAWIHHKGRNKHHFEYWTDYSTLEQRYVPIEMPRIYLIEMLCDRIAASKVYLKKDYKNSSPLEYFLNKDKGIEIHPNTKRDLEKLLILLSKKGEKETFKYIKKNRKKNNFIDDLN